MAYMHRIKVFIFYTHLPPPVLPSLVCRWGTTFAITSVPQKPSRLHMMWSPGRSLSWLSLTPSHPSSCWPWSQPSAYTSEFPLFSGADSYPGLFSLCLTWGLVNWIIQLRRENVHRQLQEELLTWGIPADTQQYPWAKLVVGNALDIPDIMKGC